MPDTIRDGRGRGYICGVNNVRRLDTSANTMPRIYYESRDHNAAWGISTPILSITTTGGRILWLKNTSTTKNVVVTGMRISYDGGTTNNDNVCEAQVWFGSGTPSANETAGSAGQLNRSSTETFDIDVYYWDEVGDGMTIASGSAGLNMMVAKGTEYFPIDGAIILGANDTFSINLKAIEAGEAAIVVRGFVEDK